MRLPRAAGTMSWVILFVAGVMEVFWALMLKQSDGLTKPAYTAAFVIGLVVSMGLLSQAIKVLPVGTAYAVWTGIGAAGTAIFGMLWLDEPRDAIKLVSLVLLIAGIIGLRLSAE